MRICKVRPKGIYYNNMMLVNMFKGGVRINKSRENYWKNRFSKNVSQFEKNADIILYSEHGITRRMTTFFRIFRDIPINKKREILDIGCGPCLYTRMIADMGYSIIGIDYTKPMIEHAIKKSIGKDISYLVSDVYSLPFKDESIDITLCIGVLQAITDERSAIAEIARILKKNGILMLMTLNSLSLRVAYNRALARLNVSSNNINKDFEKKYNPYKLRDVLKYERFDEIEIKGVYIFPKKLIPLETLFEKGGVFQIMDKIFPLTSLVAHAFLIKAKKQ